MPDNLQDLQDAIRVAHRQRVTGSKLDTLDLNIDRQPKKPSFYSYSDDTVDMKYDTLSSGELVKKYKDYLPGSDNQERLAQTQSKGEKWANGIEKFGLKTLNAVVGGTAGVVYGVGSAISEGNLSSLYDNKFSNWLADVDTKMNYQLPNYYTKQEQEKGLFGQMGTANFWADKAFGGLSFTLGAIVSEGLWAWATGGTSLATAGARWGTKLAKGARWAAETVGEEAVAAKAVGKIANLLKKSETAAYTVENAALNAGIRGGKAGELANLARFTMTSAGYESGVEALQFKKEATSNFYDNFEKLNGKAPNQDDISKFNKELESSANAVFGFNMAIVGSSNLVTMGNIFNLKSPIKLGIGEFLEKKAFGRGITEVIDDAGKVSYKAIERTTRQKVAEFGWKAILKPSLTEGLFEEGGQGVTTKYFNKWMEHTYDPKKTNETFDSAGSLYDSLAEQYGSKEGWVENGLGMIIGILGGGLNTASDFKQAKARTDYEVAGANSFDKRFLQAALLENKVKAANQIKGFNEDAQIEAKKGNVVKSQLAQNDGILAFIHQRSTMGNSIDDILEETTASLNTVSPEQWKEAGIKDVENYKQETLGELERISKSYEKHKTYWKYMIGNKVVGENTLTMGAADAVADKNLSSNNLIVESLTWLGVRGENAGKYMQDIQEVLSQQVSAEHGKTLTTIASLNKQDKKVKRESNAATKEYNVLVQKQAELVKKIERLNAAPREIETNNGVKNRDLANTNIALSAVNDKIAIVAKKLDEIANHINVTTDNRDKFANIKDANLGNINVSGETITGKDLIELEKNVEKFKTSLDFIKQTDPQRASYIEDLLDEHQQASDIFMLHQASMVKAANMGLENINTWLGTKVKGKKAMNEDSHEWLSKVAQEYKNSKVKALAEKEELQNPTPPPTEDVAKEKEIQQQEKEVNKGTIMPKSNADRIAELEKERDEKIASLEAEKTTVQNSSRIDTLKSEIKSLENAIKALNLNKQDVSSMTQDDFALYLQNNYDLTQDEIYDLLTTRPELREARLSETKEEWAKRFESNKDYRQQNNNIDNNKEMQGTSNPAWTGITINDASNKETDGRQKGYVTIDSRAIRDFASNVENDIKELYSLLKDSGYNGYLKIPGTFSDLLLRFDNIVIHGATKEDIDLALPIIEKYLNDKNIKVESTKRGKDEKNKSGKETSHTNLLAEKVKNKELEQPNTNQQQSDNNQSQKTDLENQLQAKRQELQSLTSTRTVSEIEQEIENLKNVQRLDLKEDYFTLDFKVFAYFTDKDGSVYIKEVGDIKKAKDQSVAAKNLIAAPDVAIFSGKSKDEAVNALKSSWKKQDSDYFAKDDKELFIEGAEKKSKLEDLQKELEIAKKVEQESGQQIEETKAKNESIDKQKQNIQNEYNEKIDELKSQDNKQKIEYYKKKILDSLKTDYYNIEYLGDDLDELLKARPSREDIDRYRELKKQGSQTNEMKALKRRLKNWKLLDAAIGEDYTSIADMIDIVNQHEESDKTESKVKTEITEEDLELMLDSKSELNDETLLQNEAGSVTAKVMENGNISFSHLKLGTLYERIGGEITIGGEKATPQDLDRLYTFSEDIPVTIGGINFTMKQSGKIEMDARLFIGSQDSLNLYMLNPNSTNWTYKNIFEFIAGETRKVKSDFGTNIKSNDIYNIKVDDRVDFKLDMEDPFNEDLLKKFNDGEITRETLTAQVRVAAVKNGKKVSVIKAQREGITDSNFAALRLKAAENLINNLGEDLGISTVVKQVYIGTPELQIDGNGNVVQIPITKEAASKVVIATGYIENGNTVKSNEFPNGEINESYIGKLSRKNKDTKIPFVVVKRGVHNIAYPVSFVKTADSRLKELQDVFSSNKSAQEKAIEINDLIIKYKLGNANLIVTEDLENENTLDNLQNLFDSKENYVDIENFAKKEYDRSNLTTEVTIDINLNNIEGAISDPKLRVSFEKGDVVFKDDFKEMGELPTDNQTEVDPKEERQGKINTDNC